MSLAATILQDVRFTRRQSGHNVDMHELRSRAGNTGFLDLFKADTPNLLSRGSLSIPAIVERLSDERTFTTVVMDKGAASKQVARNCVITPLQNTSQILNISLTTLVYDFDMLPQELWNNGQGDNEFTYGEDFAQKVQDIEDDVLASIEADCVTAVLNYQTQASAYNAQTPYVLSGNAMTVPLGQQFDFLNTIGSIMSLHKFGKAGSPINIVASTMYERDVNRFAENGSLKVINSEGVSNSSEGWQLGNKTFRFTDYLPAVAGVNNRVFASKPGTFGIVTNNPPAFKVNGGSKTSDGKTFEQTGALPLSGFNMGHYHYSDCLEGKQIQEFHQMSINYALITAHNSDPANEPSATFEAQMADS